MRRSRLVLSVVSAAVVLGGQLSFVGSQPAGATPPAAKPSPSAYPADSLRALAARVGLRVGTAVNPDLLGTDEKYTQIAAEQFSSVTAENAMKWSELEAVRGTYTWEKADRVVAFAKKNKQLVRGHTLVWHNKLPAWLSSDGTTTTLSNDEVKAVLKKFIFDQVRHFKGDVWQWDVVNEAFDDNGQPRQSIWYKAWGGTGYIADAYR